MALEKLQNGASLPDGLLVLEADLNRAEAAGVIEPLAESGERFFSTDAGRAYLPVLRDRLFRLGYLRVRSGPAHVDEALKNAVRQLQGEAGLTVDGWVGSQTWDALQELFAFEPTTYLQRWIDAKGITPALHRAVCLRLITLGFIPDQTRATQASLQAPLAEWRHTLVLLQATDITDSTPLDSLDLYAYLFDIDRLSRLVDQANKSICSLLDETENEDGRLLRRFLNCLLKIELWLLGYEKVQPDGKPLKISRELRAGSRRPAGPQGRLSRARGNYRYSQFYQVIRQFWVDKDVNREHGSEAEILLRTFHEIVSMDEPDINEVDERKQRTEGLIDQIDKEQAKVGEQWLDRGFIGRLWDGVKRVWRFLKRLASTAVNRIKLLVRAAHQLAAEGFTLVRRSIRIFSEGIGMLFSDEIKGSDQQIAMRHTADFDFQVFVRQKTTMDHVDRFVSAMRRRFNSLRAAMRMLKLIFQAALAAASLASGPWAWWRLLRALMNLNSLYSEEDRRIVLDAFEV